MKICVLVPTHPHVRSSKHNSRLNVSRYFGLRIILNEIKKARGITVPFVTFEEVHKYDVVLLSVHSVPDFWGHAYTFYNRLKGARRGTWMVGGAAIQNINPLVEIADFIVIGRGETIINPLLDAIERNQYFKHPSVVQTNSYTESSTYKIQYSDHLYPEALGKEKETMLGCKYNCAYCRYRISSKPPNLRTKDKDTTMPGNEETFWELEIKNGQRHTTSLDGLTEALRYAVTKPISNEVIYQKFKAFAANVKTINLKVYLICGYPGHPGLDFTELRQVFERISKHTKGLNWNIGLNFTPFSAEPGTPMQWEPVNIEQNYFQVVADYNDANGYVFQSDGLTVRLRRQVLSRYEVFRRAIYLRSSLADLHIIKHIAASPFYRSHNHTNEAKFAQLVSEVDPSKFVQQYEIGAQLPSSNIHSWRNQSSVERQAQKVRRKLAEAKPVVLNR